MKKREKDEKKVVGSTNYELIFPSEEFPITAYQNYLNVATEIYND